MTTKEMRFSGTGCYDPAPLKASRFDRVRIRKEPKRATVLGRGKIEFIADPGTGTTVPVISLD